MAAISWTNPVSGDWNVAANWSTNSLPAPGDDVTISAPGPYIVTVSSPDRANSLTFGAPQAALRENAGSLTIAGALTVNSGFVSLNEANGIGSVALAGGVLAFGNGGALGTGTVALSGGELVGTANETLGNALTLSGTATIAAAHGTTLNENAAGYAIFANTTLNFGSAGDDGTIIWHTGGESGISFPFPSVHVVAGTLEAGDGALQFILNRAAQTTVDAGAAIDLAGFDTEILDLVGAGAIVNSGAATAVVLDGANFSGAISGPLSLVVNGPAILSGASAYTGTTTIDSSLQLGAGGATGSIGGGAISVGGALVIDRDNALTLTNAISGPGALSQIGTGVTSIYTANTYSGGTTISAGTLAIGAGAALGTGTVTLSGGELLGTATETLANPLTLSGTTTIAAAHGTTLDENAPNYSVSANTTLNFGAAGDDGTVLWHTGAGSSIGFPLRGVHVQAGTLKDGDANLSFIFNNAAQTTVDAGATIDIGGFDASIANLIGAGAVANSGAAATLTLGAANFSGAISGPLSLVFNGNASLSGLEDFVGGATLGAQVRVANSGTYDIVANAGIAGTPASAFINNGLLVKTGGGGISAVTSNFVNNGELNVLGGKMTFSGGFANNGAIHGLVTQGGGVTTVGAAVPADFNGDALSDILLQSTSGQAAIWEMNGTNVIGGGAAGPNPGPGWKAIGTGDFTGGGLAGILWQNADGQALIWEMNGTNVVGGGAVGPDPGPSWKAIGTGDFNGDGLADILWQNANGQVAVWELDGTSQVPGGSAVLPVNPGPGWKAVGTGDFTGDGDSDILLQNATSGELAIWEMNGTSVTGGGVVSLDAGPGWKAIGTGDFFGDGLADILLQNTTSGQVAIWEMNGTNVVGGGTLSSNPGPSWQAIGTGDFNGDGFSDILFQNTNGQAAIWEMNGTTQIPGGSQILASNPGPTWHAIRA